jgi:hypothetical protein
MTGWRSWAIPILLAAAGCEWKITSRVGVQVMAPLARARDDGTREAPLGGVSARVECPGGASERLGSTDASGSILVTTRAPVRLDCDLAIDYRGYPVARVAVDEACSLKEAGECRVLEVRLTHDPRDRASSAEPVALRARCEGEPHAGWVRCRRGEEPIFPGAPGRWPAFSDRSR